MQTPQTPLIVAVIAGLTFATVIILAVTHHDRLARLWPRWGRIVEATVGALGLFKAIQFFDRGNIALALLSLIVAMLMLSSPIRHLRRLAGGSRNGRSPP
ncbi:hypothetical protein [uncultured Sphingomonas sp.]|uniref:hypothetical protein n=1 Tax=uncultured Sphingomonas sp. TaxID=158754 RepID=UPI0037487C3F